MDRVKVEASEWCVYVSVSGNMSMCSNLQCSSWYGSIFHVFFGHFALPASLLWCLGHF